MSSVPRAEYPRPRLVRARWTRLNGPWQFGFDDEDLGIAARWFDPGATSKRALDLTIEVPFAPESKLSGICDHGPHDVVWYSRPIERPIDAHGNDDVLLHFGAVDFHATVWIDGQLVGEHYGGHTPFTLDVGALLTGSRHLLVVRAADRLSKLDKPRGKQHWLPEGEGIFYTPTTGIWQSVWLEPVARTRIVDVVCSPDLPRGSLDVSVAVHGNGAPAAKGSGDGVTVVVSAALDGQAICRVSTDVPRDQRHVDLNLPLGGRQFRITSDATIDGDAVVLWSPESPRLYDVVVELFHSGRSVDRVETYAGMRSIDVREGRLCLNGRPYEQRLVLDQGYWPDGLMTAPTDADLRADIEWAKRLGFNGARKHQKIEDPRWLYWADRLGFLVWEELPSAFRFTTDAVTAHTRHLIDMIERDRSHPCVVAWVPINESWGVPNLFHDARQRAHLLALYHLAHALDASRPVVSNDGWEHALTDLATVHNYRSSPELARDVSDLEHVLDAASGGRPTFCAGWAYAGQPVLLTEFGGVSIGERSRSDWGYLSAADPDEFLEIYRSLLTAVHDSPVLQGFCYTQLVDVEQETNGLLTSDRQPKADPRMLHDITIGVASAAVLESAEEEPL